MDTWHENLLKELEYRVQPKHLNVSWEDRYIRASNTSKINYGCNFVDGKCRVKREIKNPDWRTSHPSCCCCRCHESKGYLNCISEEALEEIKGLFHEKVGFWREDGCALPRKYRSDICLSYNCLPNTGLQEAILKYLKTGKGIRGLVG